MLSKKSLISLNKLHLFYHGLLLLMVALILLCSLSKLSITEHELAVHLLQLLVRATLKHTAELLNRTRITINSPRLWDKPNNETRCFLMKTLDDTNVMYTHTHTHTRTSNIFLWRFQFNTDYIILFTDHSSRKFHVNFSHRKDQTVIFLTLSHACCELMQLKTHSPVCVAVLH